MAAAELFRRRVKILEFFTEESAHQNWALGEAGADDTEGLRTRTGDATASGGPLREGMEGREWWRKVFFFSEIEEGALVTSKVLQVLVLLNVTDFLIGEGEKQEVLEKQGVKVLLCDLFQEGTEGLGDLNNCSWFLSTIPLARVRRGEAVGVTGAADQDLAAID